MADLDIPLPSVVTPMVTGRTTALVGHSSAHRANGWIPNVPN